MSGRMVGNAQLVAAAYGHGLMSSQGFVDGIKRTGWVAARLFLLENGCSLAFEPFDAIRIIEAVAAGRVSEAELASWFRLRLDG